MSTDNTKWMDEKQKMVTVKLYPSKREYEKINYNFDPYDNKDAYEAEVKNCTMTWNLPDISLREAQVFAEPIRISHPDQCVSLYAGDSFVGNTSWADQMEMFWEYPVYTEAGKDARMMRRRITEEKGLIASYE